MPLSPDELRLTVWSLEIEEKATAALIRAHEEKPIDPHATLPRVPLVLTQHLAFVRRTIEAVRKC